MTFRTSSLQIATTLAASFGLSGQNAPARKLSDDDQAAMIGSERGVQEAIAAHQIHANAGVSVRRVLALVSPSSPPNSRL